MRTMEWAARNEHLRGVPRKMMFMAVGAFAKAVANLLNTTTVYNLETLIRLVRHRPPGVPLLTVSNHMSTLDDPVMWGLKDFPTTDAKLGRWVLAAEDICFRNPVLSYLFRVGKCIPITRGGGIYQEHMNEALDRLIDGAWLHTFPEGKVCQEDAPIRRLKWGTASLIARAPVTPIVLPIVHRGFEKVLDELTSGVPEINNISNKPWSDGKVAPLQCGSYGNSIFICKSEDTWISRLKPYTYLVMPENYMFGRRPPLPLCNKDISIVIGEPMMFDVPNLKKKAVDISRDLSFSRAGWPPTTPCGLDEASQRYLYTTISEQIRRVMENLRNVSKSCLKTN